jgi:glycosyl transferase family 25
MEYPNAKKAAFKVLNQFFDHVYVITIEKAEERRAKLIPLLNGLSFEFFYGMDKCLLEADGDLVNELYNDAKSRRLNRYGNPMTIGHIACSYSHCMVYRDMLNRGFKKVLILEDDVVPMDSAIHHIQDVLNSLPEKWEILYWGYDRHDKWNMASRFKQGLYHLTSALGLLKWNHTMIRNLHARPYTQFLHKAGSHDLSHAYGISNNGAQKMLDIQTPVVFNADTALAYGIANGWINGFIAKPIVFKQEFEVHPDQYVSMIKN